MANRPNKAKARFRVQRRLGTELPGLGKPGSLDRRPYPPGQRRTRPKKYSDFALRLEEKQKLRFHYGLTEKQLRRFIKDAKRGASENWLNDLIGLLERRVDNIVFRAGFAPSIRSAKQMVSHGHILVNEKKASIPSQVLKEGSEIRLKDSSAQHQNYIYAKSSPRLETPDYLAKEEKGSTDMVRIQKVPTLDYLPISFTPELFTEYYAARKV